MRMKRYLVFAGQEYYPGGGWMDFRGAFDELQDALVLAKSTVTGELSLDWVQVVDLQEMKEVATGYGD